MSTPAGNNLGDADIRVNANTDPAIRALNQFSRDAQGRLRDIRGRFVSESNLINNALTTAAGGGDRFNASLRSLTDVAGRAGSVLASAARPLAGLGAAAGSAAPLLAGVVTTLQNIAPAGAVAVTGMLSVVQASAAIKLGMVGVEDAVTAAFDSSTEGAKKFAESLEGLAPNARAFAEQVRAMAPALREFQQGVQNQLFAGFADELQRLGTSVLPVVQTNVTATAGILNQMALGASAAARQLATDGTLGKAMAGANTGLSNLQKIPAQVVTALGQLGAAAAPAFDRITQGAASAATSISERLSAAFESGALESAIDTAVGLLRDLGAVAGNVFGILGNIMRPVQEAGGGLVGVLLEITGALREATATQGFQDAITALSSVMATLARTAGPLLGQALAAIGPIFTTLGPPVETLIENLGNALSPVIEALGPVLETAAEAVGVLIEAVSPLLPVVGDLIASLLPPLLPLIEAVSDIFGEAAPIVQLLANTLAAALAPIIAQLPGIIAPLARHLSELAARIFPLLADLVVQLAPSFIQMGVALGEVLAAAGPLLTAVSGLVLGFVDGLMPVLVPLIGLIGQLAAIFATHLANVMTRVVVPALTAVTALLSGDFRGAWDAAKRVVSGALSSMNDLLRGFPARAFNAVAELAGKLRQRATEAGTALVSAAARKIGEAVALFLGLPARAFAALASLAGQLRNRVSDAGARMVGAARDKVGEVVRAVGNLPGQAVRALGNLGSLLFNAGRALLQGFIDGIRSLAGSVTSTVSNILGGVTKLFPSSPPEEGPLSGRNWVLYGGRALSEAFAEGIAGQTGLVRSAVAELAAAARVPLAPAVSVAGVPQGRDLGVGVMPTAGTVVHLTFAPQVTLENRGVIGSQFEVQNWLVRSLEDLQRLGRLTTVTAVA